MHVKVETFEYILMCFGSELIMKGVKWAIWVDWLWNLRWSLGRCCEEGARGCDYTWPYTRIFEIECVHVKCVSLLVLLVLLLLILDLCWRLNWYAFLKPDCFCGESQHSPESIHSIKTADTEPMLDTLNTLIYVWPCLKKPMPSKKESQLSKGQIPLLQQGTKGMNWKTVKTIGNRYQIT